MSSSCLDQKRSDLTQRLICSPPYIWFYRTRRVSP